MPEYQVRPDTNFHPFFDQYEVMRGDERNSKRARKLAAGFAYMEQKAMKNADTEGFAFRGDIQRDMQEQPKFSFVQPVFLYWAGWMHSAEKPPLSLQGRKGKRGRPSWYVSEILSPPMKLPRGAKYGGFPMSGWGYKVF